MPWDDRLTTLNEALAALYPTEDEARRIVSQAGVPAAFVRFNPSPIVNWHNILNEAEKRHLVPAIVAIARGEYPGTLAFEDAGSKPKPGITSDPDDVSGASAIGKASSSEDPTATSKAITPWFYLATLIISFLALGGLTAFFMLAGVAAGVAAVLVTTMFVVSVGGLVVIGAFQLRDRGRIGEQNFMTLVKVGLKTLTRETRAGDERSKSSDRGRE
jgi:hypothetical protein